MTNHTCAWCSRWTSYCNGRGKCCLGAECPVISIDPCNPTLDATGWTDESDGQECENFRARIGGYSHG